MKTVFVDTNVILDVLLQNDGFWQDSEKIFRLVERGEVKGFISASCVTDIFYIARKRLALDLARQAIEGLLSIFEVVGIDGDDLRGALSIPLEDYEDALQVYCAKKAGVDAFITRDLDGFPDIGVAVVTPTDFYPD